MNSNPNLINKQLSSRIGRENQRYNPETGARMVAGCLCLNEKRDKVIMVLSASHKDKWVLPKGGIELDEGEDFVVTAVRETWEEAGIEGKIIKKLPIVYDKRVSPPILNPGGDFDPTKVVPKTEFHFYEMVIDTLSKEWPESHRNRKWCSYLEAKHELMKSKRLELIDVLNSSNIIKDEAIDEDLY